MVTDESNTIPRSGGQAVPAAVNQRIHSSERYERSSTSRCRSEGWRSRLAISGAQTGDNGAGKRCVASVPCHAAVAEANGVVEAFTRDIDTVVVGENAQIDLGMGVEEHLQARQQPSGRESADGTHRDHFAKLSIFELVERGPDAAEGFGQHRDQGLPFIGEREPAREPAEQGYTQNFLKALDLMADGSLGHAQLQSGPREAEMTGRCLEGMQRGERQVGSDHRL